MVLRSYLRWKILPQNGIAHLATYSNICIQKHSVIYYKHIDNIRIVQVVQVDSRPVSVMSRLILFQKSDQLIQFPDRIKGMEHDPQPFASFGNGGV